MNIKETIVSEIYYILKEEERRMTVRELADFYIQRNMFNGKRETIEKYIGEVAKKHEQIFDIDYTCKPMKIFLLE